MIAVMGIEQWLAPVLAFAAWPAAVVLVVVAALVLAPRDQRPAVLAGVAEVIRAARGRTTAPAAPPARAAALPVIEQNSTDPVSDELSATSANADDSASPATSGEPGSGGTRCG